MPHPQFKSTKHKTKPKHPQDAKVYQRGLFFLCQNTNGLYFLFPLCLSRPWQSLLLGFLKSSTLVYFSVLSSCNKIYLLGISCSASSFFFSCFCWDNASFPPPAVNCVCWRGPEHSFSFVLPFTTYLETITEQICKPPEWLRNLGTWLFKNNYLREVSSEVSDNSHYNHPLWLQHGISELPAINNQ